MKIYRTSLEQNRERAAREAAEWLQAMRGEPGKTERAAFSAWVAAAPMHLEELLMAQLAERALADSRALESFDLDTVLAQAGAMDNVVPLPGARQAPPTGAATQPARRRSRRLGWALAAGLAACAVAGVAWKLTPLAVPMQQYASVVGEQRTITLGDGSVVTLAPNSFIAVRLASGRRDIELREGEATFDVAHDRTRPFRVHAGDNIVQAVGTRFTVNLLPSGTRVAVTEGKVRVSADGGWFRALLRDDVPAASIGAAPLESLGTPASLSAGEQARIPQGAQAMLRTKLDGVSGPTGGKRRLNFRNDTLADIVAEFNRYNAQPIVIADTGIARQHYSGVFDADDAASFLQFLECCSSLQVTRSPAGGDVVLAARETSQRVTD